MPKFSYRAMLRRELSMFRATGRTITLWINTAGADVPPAVPGDLFSSDTEPAESTLTKKYIWGKFEETDAESFGELGHQRRVVGFITVPMLYKSYLAEAHYIDPYNDGSRFRKSGAIVDEGRLFVTQRIESVSLTNVGDVT